MSGRAPSAPPGRSPRPPAPAGGAWCYQSGTFAGLSFRFGVRTSDRWLGHYLDTVLSSLRVPGEAAHRYSLTASRRGRIELCLDDALVASATDRSNALSWLLWHVNRSVVYASRRYLLLHAGGVRRGDAGVIVPAPSSSGKTTLVAGLVQRGFGYLSDEVVALSPDGTAMHPYPKPLAVERGSRHALFGAGVRPQPLADLGGEQIHVVPEDLRPGCVAGPCAPLAVVVPRYRPDGRTRMTRIDPADALLELATNTVNLEVHKGAGLAALAGLAERSACYRLEMSDLDHACRLVGAVVARAVMAGAEPVAAPPAGQALRGAS